jgi:hypothetical protein
MKDEIVLFHFPKRDVFDMLWHNGSILAKKRHYYRAEMDRRRELLTEGIVT